MIWWYAPAAATPNAGRCTTRIRARSSRLSAARRRRTLADAWYKGAREWDPQRRLGFANDPRNLLAVSPKANFDKAFRDANAWLPPNVAFRCAFVARQVEVKAAYGLWVSAKEKQAMAAVLDRC